VPKVFWDYTSERILVLEWINGVKLTEAKIPAQRRQALSALAVQVLMQQMFIDGIFPCRSTSGEFFLCESRR
jgi:ubiquinone biosynthesis protein